MPKQDKSKSKSKKKAIANIASITKNKKLTKATKSSASKSSTALASKSKKSKSKTAIKMAPKTIREMYPDFTEEDFKKFREAKANHERKKIEYAELMEKFRKQYHDNEVNKAVERYALKLKNQTIIPNAYYYN